MVVIDLMVMGGGEGRRRTKKSTETEMLQPKTLNTPRPKTVGRKTMGGGDENAVEGMRTVGKSTVGKRNPFVTPLPRRIPLQGKDTNRKGEQQQPRTVTSAGGAAGRKTRVSLSKEEVEAVTEPGGLLDEVPDIEYMPPRSIPLPHEPADWRTWAELEREMEAWGMLEPSPPDHRPTLAEQVARIDEDWRQNRLFTPTASEQEEVELTAEQMLAMVDPERRRQKPRRRFDAPTAASRARSKLPDRPPPSHNLPYDDYDDRDLPTF